MLASFRLPTLGDAAAAAIEERAQQALLGVYLIFHMPPQLLQHTVRRQQRLLATAVAMSTAYTSGLATTVGVCCKLRSQVCPLP